MTTIAFRDGIMAADSRATHGDAGIVRCTKLFRKRFNRREEHVIGIAGDVYSAMIFVDWYSANRTPPPAQLANLFDEKEDFGALIWTGRKLYEVNRLCRPTIVEDPYHAIGSGAAYALAAMDCGRTAAQAVRIACRRDSASGLPVAFMRTK